MDGGDYILDLHTDAPTATIVSTRCYARTRGGIQLMSIWALSNISEGLGWDEGCSDLARFFANWIDVLGDDVGERKRKGVVWSGE